VAALVAMWGVCAGIRRRYELDDGTVVVQAAQQGPAQYNSRYGPSWWRSSGCARLRRQPNHFNAV
jgi:hypothetical protein